MQCKLQFYVCNHYILFTIRILVSIIYCFYLQTFLPLITAILLSESKICFLWFILLLLFLSHIYDVFFHFSHLIIIMPKSIHINIDCIILLFKWKLNSIQLCFFRCHIFCMILFYVVQN